MHFPFRVSLPWVWLKKIHLTFSELQIFCRIALIFLAQHKKGPQYAELTASETAGFLSECARLLAWCWSVLKGVGGQFPFYFYHSMELNQQVWSVYLNNFYSIWQLLTFFLLFSNKCKISCYVYYVASCFPLWPGLPCKRDIDLTGWIIWLNEGEIEIMCMCISLYVFIYLLNQEKRHWRSKSWPRQAAARKTKLQVT